MNLKPPFDNIIPTIKDWYEKKIDLYEQLIKISSIMLAGPQPVQDIERYSQLSALVPQIRALINYADESLFKFTPMIFVSLINQKPDSKGHLSHLDDLQQICVKNLNKRNKITL